ncbi:MAG: circadian clock protein KaiC [Methanomassiliicoccales archaeon PtaU1.Bin124]|nr:MAG: circadian clock protein KaiC [Methanomassiliicoccales archaeon PtaU1.Bin124]
MDQRRRYKTYIHGFDENISGGVPQGSVVLVAGTAGTMKSSMAYYMLHHNSSKESVRGLYVSLEQGRSSLLRQMINLGFTDGQVNVDVLDLGMLRLKTETNDWMETFRYAIEEAKKRGGYELLVIDSLGALNLIARFKEPREDVFRLFEWLKSLELTTFIISEMPVGVYSYYGGETVDFLADGILHLKMVEVGETDIQRRLRCVKMRETDHSSSYYSFYFKEKGFFVTRAISDF